MMNQFSCYAFPLFIFLKQIMEEEIIDETITFSGASLGKSFLHRKYHRKLSESRGVILSNIRIHKAGPGPENNSLPFELSSNNAVKSGTVDNTLSSASSPRPISLTVFFGNLNQSVKLYFPDANLGTADAILRQTLKELQLDYDYCYELFALWMCSDFLEIQLKPHNFPLSICYAWPQLLEKYTTMSLNERNGDNVPLLVLRRNVYLSYDHEIEIVKNADKKTVELLYYEACNSVYLERLMVPFDTAILLSAINACIDPDFNDKKDDDKLLRSAFFDGYIEKTSLLRNSSQKNWIYIAINRHYICLVDFTKYSCILNISLIDCSWKSTVYMNNGIKSSYADGSSSLFLHFYPDKDQYSSKLIQFISKQTPMIEALLNSCRILTNNAENFCNFNLPQDVYYLLDRKSEFFDQNCGIYRNKLDEIVAADFDADGNCRKASGSLKFLLN